MPDAANELEMELELLPEPEPELLSSQPEPEPELEPAPGPEPAPLTTRRSKHVYRPDIDGLRTIAVLAVIVFHFFPDVAPGGFVGVDVFFVISGYLISSIISRRVKAKTFTYRNFYEARVRRIFPTLLVVLTATSAGGWLILAQRQFEWLGGSLFAGCGFAANVFFQIMGETPDAKAIAGFTTGYMQAVETSGPTNPLLHLWSLGVEEQFYLFWPLVVPQILRLETRRVQLKLYAGVFAASFCMSLYFSYRSPKAAFYLVFARFWELQSGCFLSWLENEAGLGVGALLSQKAAEVTAATGIGLVLLSIVLARPAMMFPGWVAVAPVAGTALVIFAGGADAEEGKEKGRTPLINRVVGNRVFAYIGTISYPLYLIHWPLFAYGKALSERQRSHGGPAPAVAVETSWCPCEDLECFPVATRILLVILSFALSAATLNLVEKPIRHHVSSHTPCCLGAGALFLFCLGGIIWSGGVLSMEENGYENSKQSDWEPQYSLPTNSSGSPSKVLGECLERVTVERLKDRREYVLNGVKTSTAKEFVKMFKQDAVINPGQGDNVLVWGDSHAAHLLPRIYQLASLDGVADVMPTVTTVVGGSVPPLPQTMGDVEYFYSPYKKYVTFDMKSGYDRVLKHLGGKNFSAIVISFFAETAVGLMHSVNGGTPFAWPRTLAELSDESSWPAITNTTIARWQTMIEQLSANGARQVYVVKPSVTYREPWHFGKQVACSDSDEFEGPPSFENAGETRRCSCCGPPEGSAAGKRVCSLSSMVAGKDSILDATRLVADIAPHGKPISVDEYWHDAAFVAEPLMNSARAAGAILLDPSSSMCLDGLCPVLDPGGFRAFLDSDHYRPGFMRHYGSFLDEAFNVAGIAPVPSEYCV
jgi:peptidoglycan/LPS O-acetylase OafA/YrhL